MPAAMAARTGGRAGGCPVPATRETATATWLWNELNALGLPVICIDARHMTAAVGLPTLRIIPSPRIGRYGRVESLGWVLPMDDHSFRIYVVGRVREAGELVRMRSRLNGNLWEELSEDEHRRFPGDYEAQVSQGAIAHHSEEHLATSDRGIVMLRRLLEKQLTAIQDGRDPAGVSFDPGALPVYFSAGNFLEG